MPIIVNMDDKLNSSLYKIMSIYYNHQQNLTHKNHPHIQGEWENIDHIKSNNPHKDQSNAGKKHNDKGQIQRHNHIGFDKQLMQQRQQIPHNGNIRQLDFSTSTVQSNNRRRYNSSQRDSQEEQMSQNKKSKDKKKIAEQDLVLRQKKKKKKQNSRPKYLFYNIVKQQKKSIGKQQQKEAPRYQQKRKQLNIKTSPQQNQRGKYQYEKGVYPAEQHKKDRLKNKLGFIFDMFHKNEEIASVSYYSQSNKQSMEIKNEEIKNEEGNGKNQNIFNNDHMIDRQQSHKHNKNEGNNQQQVNQNQFQQIHIPLQQKKRSKNKEQLPIQSKINNKSISREVIEQSNPHSKIITSKQRSKMSFAKSLQNKPKKIRYEDEIGQLDQHHIQKTNKSIDISKHLKSKQKSIHQESSKAQRVSKSISKNSQLSVTIIEVLHQNKEQLRKSQQKPQKTLQNQRKVPAQQQEQYDQGQQKTVKKIFPIANKVISNYMNIKYNEEQNNEQNLKEQQIPTVLINNISNVSRTRPIQIKKNDIKQTNINSNTAQISYKPLNKIQFSIDKSKRLKPQLIQAKDNLNDQQRKFLNLLKKREEALLKRVKEQVLNNNPSSILKDNQYEQKSKSIMNDFQRPQNNSLMLKIPKNSERRDKMSLKTEPQPQLKRFPTLNSIVYANQANDTFYNQSPIKRTNSRKPNYFAQKGMKGLSDASAESKSSQDRFNEIKGFRRQTSKISYYNSKKLYNEFSLKDRLNLNSKEKYDRLKTLLQQI